MHNPHMPEIPMNPDVTYFARTNFRGGNEMFGIKKKDRRQHLYILGKSGTGKSALISNMVIQDIWNGQGVCLVDPHGELVETVLRVIPEHRLNDVVYFNPSDTEFCIGFNPLELRDPKYKHLVASGLMGIFTKIWANVWSSRMEYIMNNTILALLDTPNSTLLGITRMLVDKDYRQVIINNLKDPMVKAFWVHEFEQWKEQFRNEAISPIQNKVGQFLSSSIIRNIVGQQESTIDIFNLMNEGKIFLVNVSKGRIGEDNSALLGAMIITKLQLAAMERVRIPEEERRDFYLYVDEFQNFATDSFASILSEARKYRLCLTLAHQYTAQIESKDGGDLKDAVFGNVGSMLIFRIGADDAKILEKEFAPEFIPEDFVGLPNFEIYLKLMIDGVTSRPFSANTLPPIHVAEGSDSTEIVIKRSRDTYCRPQNIVEASINSWSSTAGGTIIATKNNTTNTNGSNNTNSSSSLNKMYPAVCINCNKEIAVPFEPIAGKPIYCKECLNKIKVGELKPAKGFYDKSLNEGPKPAEALAAMGIEYQPSIISGDRHSNPQKIQRKESYSTKPVYQQKIIQKQIYQPKIIDKTKPELIAFDDNKDKDGFTSLKDLLGKINGNPSPIIKPKTIVNEIPADPKKITLHPRIIENEPAPKPIPAKAATYQSQQNLKNIVENASNTISQKKDIEDTVPKPPESYTKKTPKKEVPEDVLRKLFIDKSKNTTDQQNT